MKTSQTEPSYPKHHVDTCPVCDGNDFKPQGLFTDYYATGEQFAVAQCRQCGFTFTQDAPDETAIAPYYATQDYISLSDTNKGLMNKVYHAVRRYQLRRKRRLVECESGKTAGSLLDIGTGTGYFLNAMKQAGWNVAGVEKSAEGREFAQQHFSLDIASDITLRSLPDAAFDVVTLWHVMEHLQPINTAWEHIARVLKSDGTLIVAVPNCSSADAAHYGRDWAAWDVPRHLWHFTPETMKALAERHGFSLDKLKPMPFDAFYISMMSERYRGKSLSFLRGMWRGLLCYFKAMGAPGRSSSVIYILRRNTATQQ